MRRIIMKIVSRILGFTLVLAVIAVAALSLAYLSGMRLPIYGDLTSVAFQNWNRTNQVTADIDYESSLQRRGDRIHITVDLSLPQTAQKIRAYLDGGRNLIVSCGEQDLYLHSLQDAEVAVAKPVIDVAGNLDMELAGLIALRRAFPVAASIRTGHSRTEVWAEIAALEISGLPQSMVETVRRQVPRITYTREEILDMATEDLSPELASLLSTHREALDLAFEDITPRKEAGAVTVDATFSIDEAAAFGLVQDRFAEAARHRAEVIAEALAPSTARAQLFDDLKDLGESLGRELDKTLGDDGKRLLQEALEEGRSPA
ncbi:MAG: hypothetical protein AAF568_08480, partial [Pseudomonadota bacterium]